MARIEPVDEWAIIIIKKEPIYNVLEIVFRYKYQFFDIATYFGTVEWMNTTDPLGPSSINGLQMSSAFGNGLFSLLTR